MRSKNLLITFGFLTILSCEKIGNPNNENQINGLWRVKMVKMDTQEMTPFARWMQFNSDSTQTSGNGWLQHSVGTWSLNSRNELSVINTNGLIDDAEPFKVDVDKNRMTWQRNEHGSLITLVLERTNKLPTAEANKLFGLWKFDAITMNEKEVSDSLNLSKKAMLFLRWDHTYELHNYPKGTKYGMYKTHGHRNQIDMALYTRKPSFEFYNFNLKGDTLVFKSTNSNQELRLTRIHQFLQ